MGEISIKAGRSFEVVDIFVNDFLAEEIEIEIVLKAKKKG